MKKFATLSSEDVNLANIQLTLWRRAISCYDALDRESRGDNNDFDHVFLVDAAVCLILAGSSITQLLGQNSQAAGANSRRVPPPKALIDEVITDSCLRDRAKDFIDIYDCLRHFGEPKHTEVLSLNEQLFLDCMKTCQDIWAHVLRNEGCTVGAEFTNAFELED